MALPKEPRQKMINLMYLVLTALLALNVSAEILNAFKTVNNSLQKTNTLVSASTGTYMASMKVLLDKPESHDKAVIWYPLAAKAQQISGNAYNDVQALKDSILKLSGFDPSKNHDSSYKEDDINVPEHLMVEGGDGKKLFALLSKYKGDILAIDPSISKEFASSFPMDLTPPKSENKASDTWEGAYFHMTPSIAALTILSKFQNDIRTTENKVVEFCHKQVGQVDIPIDTYAPIVEQTASYVMNGQEVEVKAGLAALNSHSQPVITIDGQSEATGTDGLVSRKFIASGLGNHSVHVVINYKDQYGKDKSMSQDITYTVGQPSGVSISAEDVKVLYVGLDNHLAVGSGSVGAEKVNLTSDNGSVARDPTNPGVWIAHPAKAGNATIYIDVDGKKTPYIFKVKTVPDPVAMVGLSKGGAILVNDFKAQRGIRAELENFIFNGVRFSITSYTIIVTGGKKGFQFQQVTGNSFDAIRNIIDNLGPNTNVTFDEIKAVGPDGERDLTPITFNLR